MITSLASASVLLALKECPVKVSAPVASGVPRARTPATARTTLLAIQRLAFASVNGDGWARTAANVSRLLHSQHAYWYILPYCRKMLAADILLYVCI